MLDAWHVERQSTPDLANTLFAVVNGFTRAGQSQDNEAWVKLDTLGGNLAVLTEDNWQSLVSRAAKLTVKEVDGTFARWEPGRVAV